MPINGGTSLGAASGKITIDLTDLNNVRVTTQQVGQEAERNLSRIGKGAAQAETQVGGLTRSFGGLGAAAAAFLTIGTAKHIAGIAVELATASARADQMAQRFSFLANIAGESSEKMLVGMRAASRGHIADTDLMLAANRAMLLGVADNMEEMEVLMRIAGARAGAMGITFTKAFDDMVMGIGRLSPMILDNLGLMINATAAYEAFAAANGLAADKLTEAQQRQAFYNAVVAQSVDLVNQHTSAGVSNSGRLQQSAAAAENAKVAFGAMIQEDVIEMTNAYTWALKLLTAELEKAKGASSGSILGATGLEGYFTKPRIEARAMNKELEIASHNLSQAEEGLRILQDQASMGLVDDAKVQSQIDLVTQFTREVERLSGALSTVSRIGSRGPNLASVSGTVARLSTPIAPRFSTEVQAAQLDYWKAIQDIDRSAHSAIQQATELYGQQRASTVADHEKSMARESEDFARQRARAVAAHEASIARIRSDAADREAQWSVDIAARIAGLREDAARRNADADEDHNRRRAEQQAAYDERIAKLREDGLKSVAKIESDARRDSERAARQHRDTLLGAAANLDARAVAQEMRRWRTAQADQERTQNTAIVEARANLKERLEQERDNHEQRLAQDQEAFDRRRGREARDLQLRIDQEQAAHTKRIADARAADEERLEDMQEAFEERIEQEDEERAIRLGRQRQDHADQLAEMARAQALRIQQIHEQQAEQRTKLNDAFKDQLADLGLFNTARIAEQARFKNAATILWNDMWGDWYTTMEDMHRAERALAEAMGPHPKPLDYPSLLDASSLPSGYNPATSTRSTSRTITVAPGAITVYALPGQSEDYIAAEVLRLFEEAARD